MAIYGDIQKIGATILGNVTLKPKHINGVGVASITIDDRRHLMLTMTDGEIKDAGIVGTDEEFTSLVDEWLTAHPEATTTLLDGSVTEQKLAAEVLEKFIEIDPTLTESGKAADANVVGELLRALGEQVETDITLSESGKPADAKAVGDALDDIALDVETDPTLTIADMPADAKATGDAINAVNNNISEAVEDLNSAISSNANNIALQTARIDGIASLPEGSTTGDAELIDIRTTPYGKTYDSAGNAVRYQLEALDENNCLDLVKAFGFNSTSSSTRGITYAFDRSTSILSLSGTATDTVNINFLGTNGSVAPFFKAGKKYKFIIGDKLDSDMPRGSQIRLRTYLNGEIVEDVRYSTTFTFTVPVKKYGQSQDTLGFIISVYIANGNTIETNTNETKSVKLQCLSEPFDYGNSVYDEETRICARNAFLGGQTTFKPKSTILASHSAYDDETWHHFNSGETYMGIPYSSMDYAERDVFFNLSLESAFTQFKNPYAEVYNFSIPEDAPTDRRERNAAVWSGAVCSSWVSWATGRPVFMYSREIAQTFTNAGTWKMLCEEVDGSYVYTKTCETEDLEIGDIIWQEGHVSIISGFNYGRDGIKDIQISEMWRPVFTANWYSVEKFWQRIYTGSYNGSYAVEPVTSASYSIGRFPDEYTIRPIQSLHLVKDVITNKGDNVYFSIGEDVWTYITDTNHTLTITKPDGTTTTVDYTTLPQQSTNPVYNLKPVLTEAGLYHIKGANSTYASRITMYDISDVEIDATAIERTDKSPYQGHFPIDIDLNIIGESRGCTPIAFRVMYWSAGEDVATFPYHRSTGSKMNNVIPDNAEHGTINGEPSISFTIDTSTPLQGMTNVRHTNQPCFVRVYFDTGCGRVYKDSAILNNGTT